MLGVNGSIMKFLNVILICVSADKNWYEAQSDCMNRGSMLKRKPEGILSGTSYWTGVYIRRSMWIKIIGCFGNTNALANKIKKGFTMPISSAGLCQELCVENMYFSFGIKDNRCVCFQDTPHTNYMTPDVCNNNCNSVAGNTYPVELMFSEDCGGTDAFSVYSSGMALDENFGKARSCLAVQCAPLDKKFIVYSGNQCEGSLPPICNHSVIQFKNCGWKEAFNLCKIYHKCLLGEIMLNNANSTCSSISGSTSAPSWLGVAREIYISVDRGTSIPPKKSTIFLQKCQRCNDTNCEFVNCSESNTYECDMISTPSTAIGPRTLIQTTNSKKEERNPNIIYKENIVSSTQYFFHNGISTSDPKNLLQNKQANETIEGTIKRNIDSFEEKSRVLEIVLPCIAVSGIGSAAISIFLIRRRRATEHKRNIKMCENENQSNNIQPPLKKNLTIKNCVVFETNEEAEDSYIESIEGEYDHLRNGISRQKMKEDTYQHASCLEREKEFSDYDVANVNNISKKDNPFVFRESTAYGSNIAKTPEKEDSLYAKPVKSHFRK